MIPFGPNPGTILAIQRDIKHACAKLLREFRLHGEALYHPRFNTAIVVAYRQRYGGRSALQNVAWMGHEPDSCERLKAGAPRQPVRLAVL